MMGFVDPTKIVRRCVPGRIARAGVICAAAILFPVSYSAFGQTAPEPTPRPAASTPSGQSADPRVDEQSRKGATRSGARN